MSNGTNNKSIKTRVNVILARLRDNAKPGAKRIYRNYLEQTTDLTLTQHTPDRFSIIMFDWVNDTGFKVMLINNKIEWISIRDTTGLEITGDNCVGRTTWFFDIIDKLQEAATPRGQLREALENVREHLRLNSKGTSDRVTKTVYLDAGQRDMYRAWVTKGGDILVLSFGCKREVYLSLTKKEFSVSYELEQPGGGYLEYDDKQACVKSIKLLKDLFPRAFQEKGIRVA
ncbi:hypothetical protein PHABIO_281 [Pseudomonas phage Phabio]|uniref:Uncharacterized protein n=1 Tax=Pseudomonas phage Phabio TaxID=2006668 RepID=A0A1Y0STV0_9CAUD|nr:hypothetical protein MZD05_gp281 [Pseudomonas phage Phabio]ARV76912.1 hypothetical protein PHABIO_281 [Pseudomonas phage Phabio]